MSALKDEVIAQTLARVEVVYVNRETTTWWNQRRQGDDTRIFCGWYWIKGQAEAGPFKTRSSALRDAYYLYVLEREPPTVAHDMVRRNNPVSRKPRKQKGAHA